MTRIGLLGLCAAASLSLALAGCGGSGSASKPSLMDLLTGKARTFRIPSGSMEPTLHVGDRVATKQGPPALGEVVVFHPPEGAQQQLCGASQHTVVAGRAACAASPLHEDRGTTFVKRVVAGPGDELYFRAGHVYRRAHGKGPFTREPDSFTRPCAGNDIPCDFPQPITVPPGDWYLVGDNRGESDDSRFYGPVPASWIVGVVGSIYFPPERSGPVSVPSL